EMDLHLAGEGRHEDLYCRLGAHVREIEGVTGTAFAVWAPAARSVSVIGDFNAWDGRLHPMRSLGSSGIWELFLPGVGEGGVYKFEIHTQDGNLRLKADPVAFETEAPPATSSVVNRSAYEWHDEPWVNRRRLRDPQVEPMTVYEVHLGSWRRDPRRGEHPDWGTLVFNFGRNEVRNFLLASALYWLREHHTDGIRVDAVASMLYLDYSREEGQWIPNQFGGREDLDAVSFLKQV